MNDTVRAALRAKLDEIGQTLAQAKQNGQAFNEAQTEFVVLDPLLQTLGYGPLEIVKQGHNKLTGAVPDYTLLPGTSHTWFLEAKSLDFPLSDKEAAQAVNYANNHGAKWAVLTNGRAWHVYDAYLQKPLNDKRVFQLDDAFAAPDAAVETLLLMSRASMTSGGLTEALAIRELDAIVGRELETPNSGLRKSLQSTIKRETGGTVSDEAIGAALAAFVGMASPPMQTVPPSAPAPPPVAPAQFPPPGDWHTLAELSMNSSLTTGRKPARLSLDAGAAADVKSWSDVTRAVVAWIGNTHGLPPLPFVVGEKSKKYFLNTTATRADGKPMITHITVGAAGKNVAVDVNRSANDTARALLALLQAANVPAEAVRVELKPA